jgi:hypothetical protein
MHALCGLELRSPGVPTPAAFAAFNREYLERFSRMGLLIDDRMPVARTNVAGAVPEISVHAFTYAAAVDRADSTFPTFVMSAMPEVRNLRRAAAGSEPPEFVASGDTTVTGALTPDGLRQKMEFVLTAIDETMRMCGLQWSHATAVQLYTLEDAQPLLERLILPRLGPAARLGVQWHHAHPPGSINLVEIDVRGIRVETVV